jgi:single-strand DNA-binding protein
MGSVNKAILVGNLGRDAEMRFTSGGTPVATVSLATTERYTDRDGQKKEDTQWHRVVIWGKTAESIHEYLTKGKQIYVEGRIQTKEWTDKEGQKVKTTEIRADRVVLLGGGGGGGGEGRGRSPRASSYGSEGAESGPSDTGPVEAPNEDDIPF